MSTEDSKREAMNTVEIGLRQSVLVIYKDGQQEFRGPGQFTGPLESGVVVITGFEDNRKKVLLVSLLNPNIVSVEIINVPREINQRFHKKPSDGRPPVSSR